MSADPHFQKVALIGIGLIGSSMAHAMRRKGLAAHIAGYARRTETLEKAEAIGFADLCTTIWPHVCAMPIWSFWRRRWVPLAR